MEKYAHTSEDGTRKQTVAEHLMGTAELAARFAAPFGAQEVAQAAGLLHDIGKYSDAFQRRLLEGGGRTDHSTAGAQVAFRQRMAEVAFAVAGHHGGLPDGGSRLDGPDSPTLLGRVKRSVEPFGQWEKEISPPTGGVDRKFQKDNFTDAFFTRMLYSCLVDADYLDTETFMNGSPAPRGGSVPIGELLSRLERYIAPWWEPDTDLNRRRCAILRQCLTGGSQWEKGLYTLTVPTGGGKTVSSLAFALSMAKAQGMSRVVYVIPYTSIVDQTAAVFSQILGEENVLEHHSGADYAVEEGGSPAAYRKALATENWDAPVVVTTAVQFFESLFAAKSSRCRKLHNLANSVMIFDEAQTLPVPYLAPCVEAISQLVQHYGATAVLCTATQPALEPLFQEAAPDLPIREICPDTQGLYQAFRRTTMKTLGEISRETLLEEWQGRPQFLCVVNRRKTAQELYSSLPQEGSYCLTTLLCPADRKAKLGEIRRRLREGLPCRVVSTSLIEAGVDVDFPIAYREEAGLDSIRQTAGRCNREGKRLAEESVVAVFRLTERPVAMIAQNIAAARQVLRKHQDPASPEAIREYFQFYRTLKGEEALDQKQILDLFRRGYQGSCFPFAEVARRFRLIESPTVPIYIPVGDGARLVELLREGRWSQGLFRALGQYVVNVYPQHYQALFDAGALEQVEEAAVLRDPAVYHGDTGRQLDVETGKGWFL